MNTLGLTPTFGTADELQVLAEGTCTAYAMGTSYLEQLNSFVELGMSLDQAMDFEGTAVAIFCPA